MREQVRALDPDLPLFDIYTIDEAVRQSRFPQRLVGSWLAVLATIAFVLASVGVYSLTAHGVAQRTREIGVRLALGARRSQVLWLFVRHTAVHLGVGLPLGLLGALATGQLLRGYLVDTDARDPLTAVFVVVFLTMVGIIASWVPARRAARLDPVAALRSD